MLEIYAQAWVIDEGLTDLIPDAWYRGEIDEDQARVAWCSCGALFDTESH